MGCDLNVGAVKLRSECCDHVVEDLDIPDDYAMCPAHLRCYLKFLTSGGSNIAFYLFSWQRLSHRLSFIHTIVTCWHTVAPRDQFVSLICGNLHCVMAMQNCKWWSIAFSSCMSPSRNTRNVAQQALPIALQFSSPSPPPLPASVCACVSLLVHLCMCVRVCMCHAERMRVGLEHFRDQSACIWKFSQNYYILA